MAGNWRRGGIRWSNETEGGGAEATAAIDAQHWNQIRTIRFISAEATNLQINMTQRIASDGDRDEPATLHRTVQLMLGERLRAYYRPPKKLSHELFVLLMQMKEQERRQAMTVAAALKANLKPKAAES
jgi:hypothetical protein